MDDLIEQFMDAHPHLCGKLFMFLILPVIHLYLRTGTLGKILGWRGLDGFFLMPPRNHWFSRLMVRLHLMKPAPPPRSRKSKPPVPELDPDKTPT